MAPTPAVAPLDSFCAHRFSHDSACGLGTSAC